MIPNLETLLEQSPWISPEIRVRSRLYALALRKGDPTIILTTRRALFASVAKLRGWNGACWWQGQVEVAAGHRSAESAPRLVGDRAQAFVEGILGAAMIASVIFVFLWAFLAVE